MDLSAIIFIIIIIYESSVTAYDPLPIEFISSPSIYPCLDHYNLLIADLNLSSDKFHRLIRLYTTSELIPTRFSSSPDSSSADQTQTQAEMKPTHAHRHQKQSLLDLRHLNYIREFNLPPNNILQLNCQLFNVDNIIYCFVFVAIYRSNGSIFYTSQPYCKPTLSGPADNEPKTDYQLPTISSSGPSYVITEKRQPIDDTENQNLTKLVTNLTLKCSPCEPIIPITVFNVKKIHLLVCDEICHEDSRDFCLLRIPIGTRIIIRQAENFHCENNGKRKNSGRPLIVRDGRAYIDRQIELDTRWREYDLKTGYLRIETRDTEFTVDLILKPRKFSHRQQKIWYQVTRNQVLASCIGIFLISIVIIFCFICVSFACKMIGERREKIITVLSNDQQNAATSSSLVDHSSGEQWSFDDNESLEMDYYDYHIAEEEESSFR